MDKAVKYGQESQLDDAEDDVNGVDDDLTSLGKQHSRRFFVPKLLVAVAPEYGWCVMG